MNVKLATQTLSERVYSSLRFVETSNTTGFEGSVATAKFCLIFNNVFDILNCKNKYSKRNKFNIPIENSSFSFLYENAKQFELYIYIGLKDQFGTPILKSNRKTGFLVLIICLRNII